VRVIDMWATWCGPCISSLPGLSEKAEAWSEEGVTFLAVSVDSSNDKVEAFLKKNRELRNVAFTYAWSGPDAMQKASVTGIPSVFILNPDGTIAAYRRGSGYDDWLDEQLTALLSP